MSDDQTQDQLVRITQAMNDDESEIFNAALDKAIEQIPTNWLDPMLTGEEAVIGNPPYCCSDIERVLHEVGKRIGALKVEK